METKAFGSDTCFYQKFSAKAGDTISVAWQNGEPMFSTIMLDRAFEGGDFGGGGPDEHGPNSAGWQVTSNGVWVAVVIAPRPVGNFSATATHKVGNPVKVYTADQISYGDLTAENAKAMIQRVFELANQRRQDPSSREAPAPGVEPDDGACGNTLILDPQLCLAAQSHSMNMALDDFADHIGKDGSKMATRIGATGFLAAATGEILTFGQDTPEGAIKSWMESDHGHRWNLLNCDWTHTGIGVYYLANDTGSENYHYYWTMVFAVPA